MKAIVCKKFAPISELEFSDVDEPSIKENEVLVDVAAAGVNFPDGLLVQGLYQLKPELPFIPGAELAGTVVDVGANVPYLQKGMRVIGLSTLGAYAEKVAIPCMQVMPIPDTMPFAEASALTIAHATAHHALKQRAQLKAGETLLVTGAAGGTGLAAVQIGKIMGATVIALCSNDEKCSLAKEQGADHVINSTTQDIKQSVKDITNSKGVDVVYECVGGDIFHTCSRLMAWQGRLLVIGFAGGEIPKLAVNLTLVKGYSLVGVFWGSFTQHQPKEFMENMQELLTWYKKGKIEVVIDECFAMSDASLALNKLSSRQAKGKIVLTNQAK